MVLDTRSLAYCLRRVYTSFRVCSGNCHMDLEEKTNTVVTFDLYFIAIIKAVLEQVYFPHWFGFILQC